MSSHPDPSDQVPGPTSAPPSTITPSSSDPDTSLARQLPAMPSATVQSLQAGSQSLLTPPMTPGMHSHMDQNPLAPFMGRKDRSISIPTIWPDYALPETNLPSPTAKDFSQRLARLSEVESRAKVDYSYAVRRRAWSRTMQMPPGDSAMWMTLLRSRWVVLETFRGHLELWDIEGVGEEREPTASFEMLEGSVDGYVVADKAGEPLELFISTTEYRVYSFVLDLPHRGQDPKETYKLSPRDIKLGFSGLKTKQNDWWGFARSKDARGQGFLFVPHANTSLLRLAAANQVAENQNVLDILFHEDVIAVARNRSIDLYTTSAALKLLSIDQLGTPPHLQVEQSFPHTKCRFTHHARLLRRPPAYVNSDSTDSSIYCSAYVDWGWLISQIDINRSGPSTAPSLQFQLSETRRVAYVGAGVLLLSWGESGSRMLSVNPRNLSLYFAESQEASPNPGHCLAQWAVPRDVADIPRCASFDEATGIAVVGMHSGKLLVADAGNRDADSSTEGSDSFHVDSTSPAIHPSPKRWPEFGSNPAIFKSKLLPKSEYPAQLAPGWFEDVEKLYPFANCSHAYGSIPWMVQDIAGIPLGSRCILFSSRDIDYKLGSNIAFIELDGEVGNGGKLLLLLWDGEDPLDFNLYPLHAGITKEAVFAAVLEGAASLARLREDESWSLDPVSIGQLAEWAERRNPEEEEALIDFVTSSDRHV